MAYTNEVPDYVAQGTALPADKLVNGFQAGEKPPANWFNYLFNKITQAIKELQQKNYEKTEIDAFLAAKIDDNNIVSTTGTSATDVMSQNAVTTELNTLNTNKFSKSDIASTTGTSTTSVMSQNAVTTQLNSINTTLGNKVNTSSVSQTTGTSTTNIMSQNATTNAINTAKSQVQALIPTITAGTANPSGGSDGDIYIKYS